MNRHDCVKKVISTGSCAIWIYEQVVYAQPEDETHKHLWDFEIQTDHPVSVRRPDLAILKKKKEKKKGTWWIVDFCHLGRPHRVNVKESEKRNK